jgi:hypothetical protein
MSVSVCPHVSSRLPLDGLLCNLILGTFTKISRQTPNFVIYVGQKYRAYHMETEVRFIIAGNRNSLSEHLCYMVESEM